MRVLRDDVGAERKIVYIFVFCDVVVVCVAYQKRAVVRVGDLLVFVLCRAAWREGGNALLTSKWTTCPPQWKW